MTLALMALGKSAFPEKAGARTPTALLVTKSMRQYQIQDFETGGATCPECGGTYSGRIGLSKHHSAKHGEKFSPLAACDECGEIYAETVSNLHASDNHYCSDSCRKSAYADRTPWNKDRVDVKCDSCGSLFETTGGSTKRRFCSRDCYYDYRNGRSLDYAEGKETYNCDECGEQFKRWPSQGESKYCSNECKHRSMSKRTGQEHPLWKGGTDWYRAVRSSLGPTGWKTQRDDHLENQCEVCSATDTTLSLHHIVPVLSGGTNAAYNYMTLCRPCHSKVEEYTRDLPGMKALLTERGEE